MDERVPSSEDLFIPIPVEISPLFKLCLQGFTLTHLIKQRVNTSSAPRNEGHSAIPPRDNSIKREENKGSSLPEQRL